MKNDKKNLYHNLKKTALLIIIIVLSSSCASDFFRIRTGDRYIRVQGCENIMPGDKINLINSKGEYFGYLKNNENKIRFTSAWKILNRGDLKKKNLTLITQNPNYISDTFKIERTLRIIPFIEDLALTGMSYGILSPIIAYDFWNTNIWRVKKGQIMNASFTPRIEYFSLKIDTLAAKFIKNTSDFKKDEIISELYSMKKLYSQEKHSIKIDETIKQLSQTYAQSLIEKRDIDKLLDLEKNAKTENKDIFSEAIQKCLKAKDSIINDVKQNILDRIKIINSICEYQLNHLNYYYKKDLNSIMDYLLFINGNEMNLSTFGTWNESSGGYNDFNHFHDNYLPRIPSDAPPLEFRDETNKYKNWHSFCVNLAEEDAKITGSKGGFYRGVQLAFGPQMDFIAAGYKSHSFKELLFQLKRIRTLIKKNKIDYDYDSLYNSFREKDLMKLIALDDIIRTFHVDDLPYKIRGFEKNKNTYLRWTRQEFKDGILDSRFCKCTKKEYLFLEQEFSSEKWRKYFEVMSPKLKEALKEDKFLSNTTVARFVNSYEMFTTLDKPRYVIQKATSYLDVLDHTYNWAMDSTNGKKYKYRWSRSYDIETNNGKISLDDILKKYHLITVRPTILFRGDTITEIMTNKNDPNDFVKQSFIVEGTSENKYFIPPSGRKDESAQKSYDQINEARRTGKINAAEEAMLLNRVVDKSNYKPGTPDLPSSYYDVRYLGHKGGLKDSDDNFFFLYIKSWKGHNLDYLFYNFNYVLHDFYKE